MKKKIDLTSLKGNESLLVAIGMVLLAAVLSFAVYMTVHRITATQASINTGIQNANTNIQRVEELKSIKANQAVYASAVEKYSAVVADAGTYSKIERQAELEDMLAFYNLKGEVLAGDLLPYASVQMAETTVSKVVGKESDVKAMCRDIVSKPYVVRIDSFAIADNGDGTVSATFTVVDFTK